MYFSWLMCILLSLSIVLGILLIKNEFAYNTIVEANHRQFQYATSYLSKIPTTLPSEVFYAACERANWYNELYKESFTYESVLFDPLAWTYKSKRFRNYEAKLAEMYSESVEILEKVIQDHENLS